MAGDPIQFNPNNPATRQFLEAVGLPAGQIDQGVITADDQRFRYVSFSVLAVSDGKTKLLEDRLFLSPEEAVLANDLITMYGANNVLSLFRHNVCPGNGKPYQAGSYPENIPPQDMNTAMAWPAEQMLVNLMHLSVLTALDGVVHSLACPYDPNLPFPESLGVYYRPERVGPISRLTKAVGDVRFYIPGITAERRPFIPQGTASVVSAQGHVLTARHVLFGENGSKVLERKLHLNINGREFPIEARDIVVDDPANDLVLLKIPGLAGNPFIQVSPERPAVGTQVWHIGFPKVVTDIDDNMQQWPLLYTGSTFVPTFTTGQVTADDSVASEEFLCVADEGDIKVSRLPLIDYFDSSAKTQLGFSGGPVVDNQGNLVGAQTMIQAQLLPETGTIHGTLASAVSVLSPRMLEALHKTD